MLNRTLSRWSMILGASFACGCTEPLQPGELTAPNRPPPETASCAPGDAYCTRYDFTAGDTCTSCVSGSTCVKPGFQIITWQTAQPADLQTLQSEDWNCYVDTAASVCYRNYPCSHPAGEPSSYSLTCTNGLTQAQAPAPLHCATTPFGVQLAVHPGTNLGVWSQSHDASKFVAGSVIRVQTVAWIPKGMAAMVGMDCGTDVMLANREGRSGSYVMGTGDWQVLRYDFPVDASRTWCAGWTQVLNAAHHPPYDGTAIVGDAFIGSYSVSGALDGS